MRGTGAFYPVCSVSFTDGAGVRHTVEVPASTLYEAAVLAIVELRKFGFTEPWSAPVPLNERNPELIGPKL